MSLFNELKRRNVFKVGAAYVVVAWLILQVVDVVINNIGAPDWVFRVILLLLGIGLPVILLFAWAFEMTPEGLKRETQVDPSTSITNQTGRKLDFMIIGVLLLGLGYFAIDKFVLSAGRTTGHPAGMWQNPLPRTPLAPRPPATLTHVTLVGRKWASAHLRHPAPGFRHHPVEIG